MRLIVLAAVLALLGSAAHAQTQTLVDMATISMSAPGVPRTVTNTVCVTDGNDLVCDRGATLTQGGTFISIGSITSQYSFSVSRTNSGDWAEFDFRSGRTTADEKIWNIANNASTGFLQFRTLNDARSQTLNYPLTLTRDGRMGVSATTPQTSLQVGGSIRLAVEVSGTLGTCDANRTGAIRFTGGDFSFCRNGSAWETLTSLGGGGTSSPTNVPAFSVRRTSNQTISSFTPILFNVKDFDTFGDYNTGTGQFKPSVAGRYIINLSTYCSTVYYSCDAHILKNGSVIARGTGATGGIPSIVTVIVEMNGITDYITGTVNSSSGDFVTAPYTYMAGSLLASGNGLASSSGTTALGDRITSGTSAVVVNSATGIVSISQLGAVTSYVHPSLGYVGPGVSTTGPISGTAGYFSGRLGIGTSDPSSNLHVYAVSGSSSDVRFAAGTRGLHIRTDPANTYINNMDGFASNGSSSNGILYITGQQGVSIRYGNSGASGIEAFKLTSSGMVGISTSTPLTTLHVNGTLKIANGLEACDANRTGAIRYTSGDFSFCRNGSTWEPLSSLGGGASKLASLTDVVTSGAVSGSVLAFNAATSSWTALPIQQVMSTTTMVSGWPDALRCSGTNGHSFFDLLYTNGSSLFTYRLRGDYSDSSNTPQIQFSSSGAVNAISYLGNWTDWMSDCASKSIAQHYATGTAFNFIGTANTSGSTALGDRITSGTSAVVINSATGIVSISQLGSVASYIHPSLGYVGPGVSATGTVSASKVATNEVFLSKSGGPCSTLADEGRMFRSPISGRLQVCAVRY